MFKNLFYCSHDIILLLFSNSQICYTISEFDHDHDLCIILRRSVEKLIYFALFLKVVLRNLKDALFNLYFMSQEYCAFITYKTYRLT